VRRSRLHATSRRVWALSLLALLVTVLLSGTARAGSDSTEALFVRAVDASNPSSTAIGFVYTGGGDVSSATVKQNGKQVDASAPQPLPDSTPMAIAFVFDVSNPMDSSGALAAAKDEAKQWLRGLNADERAGRSFAVYSAGVVGDQLQDFTSDVNRTIAGIDKVAPANSEDQKNQSALWSAIRQAGNGLDEQGGQANLIVMAGRADNASGGDAAAAKGALATASAAVFAGVYTGSGSSDTGLSSLVSSDGGQLVTATDGPAMGQTVRTLTETVDDGQYLTTYDSGLESGTAAELEIAVGDTNDTVQISIGSAVTGAQALHSEVTTSSGGIAFLQSGLGLLVTVLLVLVAAAGIAYGLTLVFVKDDQLSTVLQPYADPYGQEAAAEDDDPDTGFAKTALIQRAVEITEQVAADRGLLSRAEIALERANLPLRAGEALFFYGAVVIVVTILALAVTGSIIGGVLFGALAAVLPIAVVNFMARRRRSAFMGLLPDTLQLLSGTLRAGYSLMQGVEAVSQEVAEPMGTELRRVVTEARLGRQLEDALDGTAERMGSPDFAWAVMAIRIQREVGGNLSELLLTVAETMIARERLRRDIRSLTAEGRVSAIVLGFLPVGLGFAMWVINPDYVGRLFDTTAGNIMLGVALVAMAVGFFWMKKIIDIEI
jgi:tight adherence protein B